MRLFVAVNLPRDERAAIHAATAPLRAAALPVRWLEPDAYHVTLKFLGQVAEADLEPVAAALLRAAAGQERFTMRLAGAGAFPNPRRPSVFWLGVRDAAPLAALQRRVEAEITPLGFATETRPFHPHLTLGRSRRDAGAGALGGAEALLHDVACDATIPVETVDLMRSHLSPRGARYERMLAAALAA